MNNIKKNYILNVFYQLLVIVLPLITAPYVARILGATGTGIYSYTHSIAQYFVLIIMLGLNNYGNRSIAKSRDDKNNLSQTFSEIYTMQFITGIISLTIFIILIFINFFDNSIYMWLQIPYILSAIFDINWFFFGIEEFQLTVTRNSIIKLLTVILTFAFVKSSTDLWKYILLLSSGMLLSNLILWPFLFNRIKIKKVTYKDVSKHIKENLILFVPVIATSIYTVMDKIMLGFFTSVENVGYYEYAERIRNIPMGLISALGTVMMPRMSNLIAKNKKMEVKKNIDYSMDFIIWLSVALTFGIASVSKEFIPLFLGPKYDICIIITPLLCSSIILVGWANVIRTQYLIPMSRNSVYVKSTIIGAVVNFIINFILLRIIGIYGVVLGTLCAEFSVAFYQSLKIYKELSIIKYICILFKYIFIGVIMFLINKILELFGFSNFFLLMFKIILGIIIYFGITLLVNKSTKSKSIINIKHLKDIKGN